MRALLVMMTALSLMLGGAGCAHSGDPLPPRAKKPGAPEFLKDHPLYQGANATAIDVDGPPAEPERSLCSRPCPDGHHCVTNQGVDRCVPNGSN